MLRKDIPRYFSKFLSFFLKNWVFTIRMGLAKGLKRRYGQGFRPKFSLTQEEEFLSQLNFENKVVFDVGSYIGIYTLFFARAVGKSGQVIAIEPNPSNYEELCYHIQLNNFTNVVPLNMGLGKENAQMKFAVSSLYPARGTFDEARQKVLEKKGPGSTTEIAIRSLDSLFQTDNLPHPDFIKIDVEGLELDVLLGMTNLIHRYQPALFIEIHGVLSPDIVAFLQSQNYSIYHVESDSKIMDSSGLSYRGGHLFCE